ncbi:uncharacterized protein LOC111378522 [Olea europaea var. sylvestris]|uniref:uncharacterized protein LOC111378522 n=1 Tax=Olea europaea var. sylvestris TaxID=158386 RepID=UPI000C1D4F4C|nr:uncharacterized protein LOC111378522 [Olea europaea var. sylvestris]
MHSDRGNEVVGNLGEDAVKSIRNGEQGVLLELGSLGMVSEEMGIEMLDTIWHLLKEYGRVFGESYELFPTRTRDHAITLQPGTAAINVRPYCYPYAQKNEIEKLVQEMLVAGIIQPSHSPFSSPVLLIKMDGSWRFCVDYRALNKDTIRSGLRQKTSPRLLSELTRVITSSCVTVEEHCQHLHKVLGSLQEHKLFANAKKRVFGQQKIEYLGHIISEEGVATDQSKIKAMICWPPRYVKEL